MKRILVKLKDKSYPIYVNEKLKNIGKRLASFKFSKKIFVITNQTVAKLYLNTVKESLIKSNFSPILGIIPDGERYKSLKWVYYLYNIGLKNKIERNTAVITLGGGVIGDIGGYVASTLLRGLPLIHIPTTLLAQVDSSIGGKVGVNHFLGKNLIGSFYQPRLVFVDFDVLSTLPKVEIKCGLSEIIKYGIILDKDLFAFLEKEINNIERLNKASLIFAIKRSCELKVSVVEKDEREKNIRAILNFGHTLGHSLESITSYKCFKHGQAVAIGMVFASHLSYSLGILSNPELVRIEKLILKAKLPVRIPRRFNISKVIEKMYYDKKKKDEKIRFVLPVRIGKVNIYNNIPLSIIKTTLNKLRK